jgi:NAD(P)-dependent dehydrogenase (short-subunit alcohol dehydrogenase family)
MRNLKKRGQLDQALRTAGVQDKVYVEELDVTSKASIQAATDSILVRTGTTLDAVVHNAGVAAAGALEDVPESELRRVMETNFFGVLSLTRALLPTFRAKARTHRHHIERSCLLRSADECHLLRLKMGHRRMGRGNSL